MPIIALGFGSSGKACLGVEGSVMFISFRVNKRGVILALHFHTCSPLSKVERVKCAETWSPEITPLNRIVTNKKTNSPIVQMCSQFESCKLFGQCHISFLQPRALQSRFIKRLWKS